MRFSVLLVLALALHSLAFAQSTPDDKLCEGSAETVDDRIAACTRAITSGKHSTNNLARTFSNRGGLWTAKGDYDRAIADFSEMIRLSPQEPAGFNNRGTAWRAKGDYDRAITDYNEAIRLNPQHPQQAVAFNNRGMAWAAKGDYDRSISDYNEAIHLNPKYARALNNRGVALNEKGDYDRAITDFSAAIRLDPHNDSAFFGRGIARYYLGLFDTAASDFAASSRLDTKYAYSPIWRSLALFRSGKADLGRSESQRTAQNFTQGEWPEPVMELFSGRIDPPALLNAAENPDAKKRTEQVCEAHFYLGEYQLLKNQWSEARALLQIAVDECPKTFSEFGGAVAELKRLPP
jgi:lipoprotein NlpI